MKDVQTHAPISELTPDGLAKSWFAIAVLAVLGDIALVLILLFALH